MKKVLEIITLASSAEAFIGDQFSYFQIEGDYEMHLICTPNDTINDFVNKQNIQYCPIEISRQFSIKKDFRALWQIRKYIKRNKFDTVIVHYFPKACFLTILACLFLGIKHKVIIAHGVLHDTMTGLMRKLVIWEQKWDVMHVEKVICVSNSVAKRRAQDGIEKPKKQIVLGGGSCNGVDAFNKFNPDHIPQEEIDRLRESFGLAKDTFVVGFSGRLVRDKGVTELLEGFKTLKGEHKEKNIKLLIIGSPEKRDALPAETMDYLNDNKDIIFTGRVPYHEIQKYYLLMDMLVLPSYREGFPTVVLEAGAMGIPVAVSKSTGCIDSIVDGKTGIFIDIEGTSIKDGIVRYFDDEFRLKIGKQARTHVLENYEHTIIRKHMLEVLDSLN